ncbi:putative zinc transporter ZIP13-like [Penaeus vannamei]|uniref:Putative zinc transporter ZIP13-like n=1 Tax=Penaeus vannamei TaxID=6689 RepID=A0A423TPB2_PENVA|nr:putative zinc transporter ZIP13-like [Penaeus vannamei]
MCALIRWLHIECDRGGIQPRGQRRCDHLPSVLRGRGHDPHPWREERVAAAVELRGGRASRRRVPAPASGGLEYGLDAGAGTHEAFTQVGLCVLAGIFVFIIVEMMASNESPEPQNNNSKEKIGENKKDVTGYLNLIANGIDNFTHGLAVAGSFMVSYKTGILTTGAILIHEIPHEIGDFAILLKSGFSRWEATLAQLYTAGVGLLGALFTLFIGTSESLAGIQVYILAFTAGGFLNIALVTVLPELLQEDRPAQSCAQLLCLLLGTFTMATVATTC